MRALQYEGAPVELTVCPPLKLLTHGGRVAQRHGGHQVVVVQAEVLAVAFVVVDLLVCIFVAQARLQTEGLELQGVAAVEGGDVAFVAVVEQGREAAAGASAQDVLCTRLQRLAGA